MYFLACTGPVTSTEDLKYQIPEDWLFLSILSVIFRFLTPKNLPIPNFKMKG